MTGDKRLRVLLRALPLVIFLGGCQASKETSTEAGKEGDTKVDKHAEHAGTAAPAPKGDATGHEGHQTTPGTGAKALPGYAIVKIDPSRQQMIGLRTSLVTRRAFSRTLQTVGIVSTDETSTAHVHVKFAGWVEDVFVDFVGKSVQKGQPLMSIYSPELWTAQNEYIQALQSAEQYAGNGTPDAPDAPDAAVTRANQEMLEAARQRLKLWDIPNAAVSQLEKTRKPRRTLTLNAPISGTVLVRNVLKGMYVDPGSHLFIIANLSKVWVRAQVYEYEMPFVAMGQEASLTLESLPGKTLKGAVKFIQPTVSESTRTNEIRLEFDNQDGSLKPNMFATVELKLDMGEGLALPDEAVIDTGVRKVVFVARDDRTFEPRDVKLGARVEDYYQVLEGLAEGEKVVVSAQFLLDSESQLKGAGGTGGGHAGHGG